MEVLKVDEFLAADPTFAPRTSQFRDDILVSTTYH